MLQTTGSRERQSNIIGGKAQRFTKFTLLVSQTVMGTVGEIWSVLHNTWTTWRAWVWMEFG
jgi:hypothetical protein